MPRHLAPRTIVMLAFATASVGLVKPVPLSTGRFELDVQRSKVLRLGKSYFETSSAFAILTTFFNGRTNGLEIHLYATPIDAAARARLLKNERDDQGLLGKGAGYIVFFLDKENRITQANVTVVIPGTTVTRTVAYTQTDIAKWFSNYHYADGRLQLKSKATYATGADPNDDKLTLSWDVALDVPVVDRTGPRR